MTKLMFLQASPRSTESKSIEIAQAYLDTLCAKNPDLVVDNSTSGKRTCRSSTATRQRQN